MDTAELNRQIADVIGKGFDESFIRFCAETFSSYDYPAEHLAAARMHAHYLRLALEALSNPETRERLLSAKIIEGEGAYMSVCLSVAEKSYRSALESDRPICEVFVERWCSYFAIPASDKTESGRGKF